MAGVISEPVAEAHAIATQIIGFSRMVRQATIAGEGYALEELIIWQG